MLPAPVQVSAVGSGSQVAGLSPAMTGQPVDGNKIIVPIAYYEGFRGIDDPTDIGATVWLDVSDLASLAPNEDGS